MSKDNSKTTPKTSGTAAPDSAAGGAVKDKSTGSVKFDERGTAIWEWAITTGAFSQTERLKKLQDSPLSLADDAPTPFDVVKANPLGMVKGYNPYDSGKLSKADASSPRKDLQKLSEWLKLRKQASNNDPDEE